MGKWQCTGVGKVKNMIVSYQIIKLLLPKNWNDFDFEMLSGFLFENLSVLVPYIILDVMDVFLPEVIFVSDKGLHHLNTWTILKDQGWLGGIQNTKISKPEAGGPGPLDLPSLPRQKMRSWCSLQQPPWEHDALEDLQEHLHLLIL